MNLVPDRPRPDPFEGGRLEQADGGGMVRRGEGAEEDSRTSGQGRMRFDIEMQ